MAYTLTINDVLNIMAYAVIIAITMVSIARSLHAIMSIELSIYKKLVGIYKWYAGETPPVV